MYITKYGKIITNYLLLRVSFSQNHEVKSVKVFRSVRIFNYPLS